MKHPLVAYYCYKGVMCLYDVILNGNRVGYITIESIGLYYKFFCECTLPDNKIYRLFSGDKDTFVKLGICVPEGGKFVLNTRLPRKVFSEKPTIFWLMPNVDKVIYIENGKHFDYLDKLDIARLKKSNGQQYYILISSPTGQ